MQTEELYEIFLKAENGITTDTRACGKGMLFFALHGENFNGNKFAHDALKAGCIAAVVDDASIGVSDQIILVDDVLKTLQNLAKFYRRTFIEMPVLGITGSNGKTTMKGLTTLSGEVNVRFTVLLSRFDRTQGRVRGEKVSQVP